MRLAAAVLAALALAPAAGGALTARLEASPNPARGYHGPRLVIGVR
jgi:hypothetical protein